MIVVFESSTEFNWEDERQTNWPKNEQERILEYNFSLASCEWKCLGVCRANFANLLFESEWTNRNKLNLSQLKQFEGSFKTCCCAVGQEKQTNGNKFRPLVVMVVSISQHNNIFSLVSANLPLEFRVILWSSFFTSLSLLLISLTQLNLCQHFCIWICLSSYSRWWRSMCHNRALLDLHCLSELKSSSSRHTIGKLKGSTGKRLVNNSFAHCTHYGAPKQLIEYCPL